MHNALKSAVVLAAAVVSMAASAQHPSYHDAHAELERIDARQAQQSQRIERGVARGQLTRLEARTLRQGQREIARTEARAKADGRVSRRELRELTALLDQADAQIRDLRHDRDGRHPG